MMSDVEDLRSYRRQRDAESFHRLVLKYQAMVYSTCSRALDDLSEAEDAVQETFLKLAKSGGSIRSNVGAWLHSCALNIARNRRSSIQARQQREETWSQMQQLENAEDWRGLVPVIDDCIAELPEDDRELLVQHYFAERTQTDLATERGISRQATAKQLERVVGTLRQGLRGRGVTVSAAILGAFLAESTGSAAVPATLTASLCKIGLVGVSEASGATAAGVIGTGLLGGKSAAAVAAGVIVVLSGAMAHRHRTKPYLEDVVTAAAPVARPARPQEAPAATQPDQPKEAPAAPTVPPQDASPETGGAVVAAAPAVRPGPSQRAAVTPPAAIVVGADVLAPHPASASADSWRTAATLVGHKDVVQSLTFSPDGSRLYSGSSDGEIKVWDPHAPKELASITAHEGRKGLSVLAVSPSGELLASGRTVRPPGEVKLWDARTLQLRATLSYPRPVYCLGFSRNSELIAAAGENEVYIWSVRDYERKHKLSVEMSSITGLAFSADGRVLYVGGSPHIDQNTTKSGILRAWDLSTGTKLGEIDFPYWVAGIDLSRDGATLGVAAVALHVIEVASADDRVTLTERFSALDRQGSGRRSVYQEQFEAVALSPEGEVIAGAAGSPGPLAPEAGHIALFALQTGRRIAQLRTPRPTDGQTQAGERAIKAVAFSHDGRLLAGGGRERAITLWVTAAISE